MKMTKLELLQELNDLEAELSALWFKRDSLGLELTIREFYREAKLHQVMVPALVWAYYNFDSLAKRGKIKIRSTEDLLKIRIGNTPPTGG